MKLLLGLITVSFLSLSLSHAATISFRELPSYFALALDRADVEVLGNRAVWMGAELQESEALGYALRNPADPTSSRRLFAMGQFARMLGRGEKPDSILALTALYAFDARTLFFLASDPSFDLQMSRQLIEPVVNAITRVRLGELAELCKLGGLLPNSTQDWYTFWKASEATRKRYRHQSGMEPDRLYLRDVILFHMLVDQESPLKMGQQSTFVRDEVAGMLKEFEMLSPHELFSRLSSFGQWRLAAVVAPFADLTLMLALPRAGEFENAYKKQLERGPEEAAEFLTMTVQLVWLQVVPYLKASKVPDSRLEFRQDANVVSEELQRLRAIRDFATAALAETGPQYRTSSLLGENMVRMANTSLEYLDRLLRGYGL